MIDIVTQLDARDSRLLILYAQMGWISICIKIYPKNRSS